MQFRCSFGYTHIAYVFRAVTRCCYGLFIILRRCSALPPLLHDPHLLLLRYFDLIDWMVRYGFPLPFLDPSCDLPLRLRSSQISCVVVPTFALLYAYAPALLLHYTVTCRTLPLYTRHTPAGHARSTHTHYTPCLRFTFTRLLTPLHIYHTIRSTSPLPTLPLHTFLGWLPRVVALLRFVCLVHVRSSPVTAFGFRLPAHRVSTSPFRFVTVTATTFTVDQYTTFPLRALLRTFVTLFDLR